MAADCILVVDDDASLGRAMQRMVRAMDISCEVSNSADDLLARVAGLRPTYVLLDIHMPDMSGLEALAAMRARGIDVPTVMMTGVDRDGTREACLSAGAAALLAKPVDAGTIAQLYDRFGGRRRQG